MYRQMLLQTFEKSINIRKEYCRRGKYLIRFQYIIHGIGYFKLVQHLIVNICLMYDLTAFTYTI